MEEGRLPKEVTKWRPPGKRQRGRPKLSWAKGIIGRKKRGEWKKTGMTEATGGRRLYNC
jgi:hypothetical protein